jgi:hypothetical protein
MQFTWSDRGRTGYEEAPQRTRYLACDYLANRPPHYTPVSCFQVASHKKYPLYWTVHKSYVMIKTNIYLYLLTSAQLKAIVGDWPSWKPNPSDADRTFQVNTFPKPWKDDPSTSEWANFAPYRYTNVKKLYLAIIRHCHAIVVSSGGIYQMLPRPVNPQPRLPLGSIPSTAHIELESIAPEDGTHQLVNRLGPKHRRGERKKPRLDILVGQDNQLCLSEDREGR